MTVLMLLWNYLITPLYMHTARADVAAMLVPVFLPFNLLKGCLNATITVLLYKPVVQGLRHAHLLPPSKTPGRMPVKRPSGRVARRAGRSGRVHRAHSDPARNDLSLRGAADQ